jgi:hypothetical protein
MIRLSSATIGSPRPLEVYFASHTDMAAEHKFNLIVIPLLKIMQQTLFSQSISTIKPKSFKLPD